MKHKELWTVGRRQCNACIELTIYRDNVVIATSETDHITQHQMQKALEKEYPHHVWVLGDSRYDDNIKMIGKLR